jgi:hypothetical protein
MSASQAAADDRGIARQPCSGAEPAAHLAEADSYSVTLPEHLSGDGPWLVRR